MARSHITETPFACRTPLGRGRAWLRLALMQKKLSDYIKTIINRKDLLRCANGADLEVFSAASPFVLTTVSSLAASSTSPTR